METDDIDLDLELEAIRAAIENDPEMHVIHHVNAWAEVNAMREDLNEAQGQIDILYSMVLQLAGALNQQVLPVPISFDALEKE